VKAPPLSLDFGAGGHLYATHALHAFAARCPAPLVDWVIQRFSTKGDIVFDPMVGSGTTLVEACLLGRRARGADIDPLARLIAKVKATPIEVGALDRAIEKVDRLMRVEVDDGWRPDLPRWGKWFRPRVAADLARLRRVIRSVATQGDLKDLLWVAFSSLIIARTSVANVRDLVHSRHHYRTWPSAPDVCDRFLARLRQYRRMMADYKERLDAAGQSMPDIAVVRSDARSFNFGDATVDLVCTSPPYCSALDYTRAHIFAVAWMCDVLGTTTGEYRALGRRYIGTERAPLAEASGMQAPPRLGVGRVDRILDALAKCPERAWIVYRYFRDMKVVMDECARVLRPSGKLVLIVCPSNIRKISIPTHKIFAEMTEDCSLQVSGLFERRIHERRRMMPYLKSKFGPRMSTEYVLIIERAGRGRHVRPGSRRVTRAS
jgi:DNA modification methylase